MGQEISHSNSYRVSRNTYLDKGCCCIQYFQLLIQHSNFLHIEVTDWYKIWIWTMSHLHSWLNILPRNSKWTNPPELKEYCSRLILILHWFTDWSTHHRKRLLTKTRLSVAVTSLVGTSCTTVSTILWCGIDTVSWPWSGSTFTADWTSAPFSPVRPPTWN